MNLFAQPEWLLSGLLATTAVGFFLWWSELRKIRRLKKFTATKLLSKLSESHSRPKTIARNVIYSVAILLLFLALAKPQWGKSQRKAIPTGIDVLLALDVSRSMLARDVRPNRIERVKLGISNLLEKVKGDRLGLILPDSDDFVDAIYGAMIAGVVPVPIYPPMNLGQMDAYMANTTHVLDKVGASLVITEARAQQVLGRVLTESRSVNSILTVDKLLAGVDTHAKPRPVDVKPDDLAVAEGDRLEDGRAARRHFLQLGDFALLLDVERFAGLFGLDNLL